MEKSYDLGSLVIMKKGHPCGENLWEVVRLGADIRINALKATLNNALSNYGISDIDIDIANTVQVNKNNVISIGNTQKAFPNKILTSIEYVGGE